MPEPTPEQIAITLALGNERIRRAFNSAVASMRKFERDEEDINLIISVYKDIMKPAEPKEEPKPVD
jgi:hypothetical protein